MVAGPVGGGNEEKKELHGLAVEALELDPCRAHRHGTHQPGHARVLRVGHGHAAADPGAAEILAFHDRLDDALLIPGHDAIGIDEGLHHLANHAFLRAGFHLGTNGVGRDKI